MIHSVFEPKSTASNHQNRSNRLTLRNNIYRIEMRTFGTYIGLIGIQNSGFSRLPRTKPPGPAIRFHRSGSKRAMAQTGLRITGAVLFLTWQARFPYTAGEKVGASGSVLYVSIGEKEDNDVETRRERRHSPTR